MYQSKNLSSENECCNQFFNEIGDLNFMKSCFSLHFVISVFMLIVCGVISINYIVRIHLST